MPQELTHEDHASSLPLPPTQPRRLQSAPGRNTLPEIGWLEVGQLFVDYTYQHRPYTRAIADLEKEFNPDISGFILVNIRTDGTIAILDGQTRRAVHEKKRLRHIRAEILRGLSEEEEAAIYLKKCINTQRLPVDSFLAELKAKHPQATLIAKILSQRKLEIESYATQHGQRTGQAVITCVTALKRMLQSDPDGDTLGAALDLIIDTWGYARSAFTAQTLEVIHGLVLRYGSEIDRKIFITKLGHYPLEDIREQGRTLYHASMRHRSLRAAIQEKMIEIYNVGRPADKRLGYGN